MAEGSHMYMGTCADLAQAANSTSKRTMALSLASRPAIAVMAKVPVWANTMAAPDTGRARDMRDDQSFMPAFLAVGVM